MLTDEMRQELIQVAKWIARKKPAPSTAFQSDFPSPAISFGHFQGCATGDGVAYRSGCQDADLDGNGDVSSEDFSLFLQCMGGPDASPGF